MQIRSLMLAPLALAVLPLSGCADDYGYHRGYVGYRAYPVYYGWYDGFYGPVYDGYWGEGGYYYYRMNRHDRWRRDDDRHFRAEANQPAGSYYRYDRAAPPRNWHRDQDRDRGRDRGRERERRHDRHRDHDRD